MCVKIKIEYILKNIEENFFIERVFRENRGKMTPQRTNLGELSDSGEILYLESSWAMIEKNRNPGFWSGFWSALQYRVSSEFRWYWILRIYISFNAEFNTLHICQWTDCLMIRFSKVILKKLTWKSVFLHFLPFTLLI